jgi:hypothetical protein
MKKIIFFTIPIAAVVILLFANSGNLVHYPGGAPAGYTGSPHDGQNCKDCHNGSVATVQNWITSNVDPTGYLPGQTYTITLTDSGSGKKGFEVSAQNPAGNFLGTLINGSGTEFAEGNPNYITHSSSSNSNPKVWTIQWTAPASGSGPVTFYGAFALNMSATKLSTLVVQENIGTGVSQKPAFTPLTVSPNPADKEFSVSFNLDKSSDVEISLVNSETGVVTLVMQEKMEAVRNTEHFNCSAVAGGLYILRVRSDNQEFSKKIIISH